MKSLFRPTAPTDRIQLSGLLAEAFDTHSDAGSLLNPAMMAWKYWDARDDWTGPRGYVLERDGRIIAHAGIWPVTFPGENPIRGVQMIDWCAAKDSPGVGLTLVQKLASLFDFMYSIGGSDMTCRALPAFGFVEATQVWTAARPLRPLRQMLTHQTVNWKLAPRLVRNWAWANFPATHAVSGWKTGALRPSDIPEGLVGDGPEAKCIPRSSAFFEYLLRCPTVSYELHGIANERGLQGYFAIGLLRGQARIAGVWLRNPSEEGWCIAYTLAQQTARQLGAANEVVVRGSVGVSEQAASQTGLRIMKQTPVYLLNKKGKLTLPDDFQFQMCDDDTAFLDSGQASYNT
jgi:hypothetical protein